VIIDAYSQMCVINLYFSLYLRIGVVASCEDDDALGITNACFPL
jgi:hypothetical protein